jgi:hypothetical protein
MHQQMLLGVDMDLFPAMQTMLSCQELATGPGSKGSGAAPDGHPGTLRRALLARTLSWADALLICDDLPKKRDQAHPLAGSAGAGPGRASRLRAWKRRCARALPSRNWCKWQANGRWAASYWVSRSGAATAFALPPAEQHEHAGLTPACLPGPVGTNSLASHRPGCLVRRGPHLRAVRTCLRLVRLSSGRGASCFAPLNGTRVGCKEVSAATEALLHLAGKGVLI